MANPLFFQESYFFLVTPIDENTNYKYIRPVIWDCQELYIQDILGTPLYNEIKSQIVANTLTVLNTTLLETYVVPCLINYVLSEVQWNLNFKFRNKSVNQDRSDFTDPIDYTTFKNIREQFAMKAQKYADKIEKYLCANTDDYPLYTTYTTSDEVRAQKQKPSISVYLGGGESKECNLYD